METRAQERVGVDALAALLAAALVGASALVAPAAALLMVLLLAARALTRSDNTQIDWASLAGPAFACVAVAAFAGLAGAIGVLFVWRLVSDVRWSVGEAARLAHAAGRPGETTRGALAHAWLSPLYGLALVAYTAPHMVAGLPLDLPHVPLWVPLALGIAALAAVSDWALRRAADWRLGELAPAPTAHVVIHHLVFVVAFGVGLDVSSGLLALVAWRLAHVARLRLPQPSFTAVP